MIIFVYVFFMLMCVIFSFYFVIFVLGVNDFFFVLLFHMIYSSINFFMFLSICENVFSVFPFVYFFFEQLSYLIGLLVWVYNGCLGYFGVSVLVSFKLGIGPFFYVLFFFYEGIGIVGFGCFLKSHGILSFLFWNKIWGLILFMSCSFEFINLLIFVFVSIYFVFFLFIFDISFDLLVCFGSIMILESSFMIVYFILFSFEINLGYLILSYFFLNSCFMILCEGFNKNIWNLMCFVSFFGVPLHPLVWLKFFVFGFLFGFFGIVTGMFFCLSYVIVFSFGIVFSFEFFNFIVLFMFSFLLKEVVCVFVEMFGFLCLVFVFCMIIMEYC